MRPAGANTAKPFTVPEMFEGLWEILRAAEGGPHLEPVRGHICWGHYITDEEREARRFSRRQTPRECDELLLEDLQEARGEALRVFGKDDDGRVELCFLTGCDRFGRTYNLASAVRTDEELEQKHATRAFRIAATIERHDSREE